MKAVFLLFSFLLFLVLGYPFVDVYIWYVLLLLLYDFLKKFGTKFLFVELIALIAWLQFLVSPLIFKYYGVSLFIDYHAYFSYAIPAISIFIIGLFIPNYRFAFSQFKYLSINQKINQSFLKRGNHGSRLVYIGLPIWIAHPYIPASVSYITFLFSMLMLVGMTMLIFSNNVKDKIILGTAFFVMMSSTLLTGMIGVTVFWLIILLIYRSLSKPFRIPLFLKVIFFSISVFFLVVLQSAKSVYRAETWKISTTATGLEGERKIKQDPLLFYEIIKDKLVNPDKLLNNKNIIVILSRLNQGYIVSMVMHWVPKMQEFGNGDITLKSTLSAFVPRVLYPDKPFIATSEYYKKYTGFGLGKYHSATLGALGDAYADWGYYGSIFMLFFGLFIAYIFRYFYSSINDNPLLLFWFAIIFYFSITVNEISIPGYINAIFKVFLFIWPVRFILKKIGLNV